MRLRRIHNEGDKRISERNAALIRIQLEAQARNRRWYEFLCARRDELHARLRQQGYSPGSENSLQPGTVASAGGGHNGTLSLERSVASPIRRGLAVGEKVDEPEAAVGLADAQEGIEPSGDAPNWSGERDPNPL